MCGSVKQKLAGDPGSFNRADQADDGQNVVNHYLCNVQGLVGMTGAVGSVNAEIIGSAVGKDSRIKHGAPVAANAFSTVYPSNAGATAIAE